MKNLLKKMFEAQKTLGWIEKKGQGQGYKFAEQSDVTSDVKEAYISAGLVILTNMKGSEIGQFDLESLQNGSKVVKTVRWAKVTMEFIIADPETGETFSSSMDGYAENYGDKALNAAITYATKYFYLKCFAIATGKDPESEESPQGRKSRTQANPTNGSHASSIMQPLILELRRLQEEHSLTPAIVEEVTGYSTFRGLPFEEFSEGLEKLKKHLGTESRK